MKPKVYNRNVCKRWPVNTIYVGRGSAYGNPFKIGEHGSREEVVARYEKEVLPTLDLKPLRGKNLMCYCAPLLCHADILLREANKL